MPAKDVQLTGKWTAVPYAVTYSYTGDLPADATALLPGTVNHTIGDEVTIAGALTLEGYTFSGWTVTTSGVTVTDNKFTMPAKAVEIKGSWAIDEYTITTNVTNGTIDPPATVEHGSSKTINYAPAANYHLVSVTVDGSSVSITDHPLSYTFSNVKTNHSISVVYRIDKFKIKPTVKNGTITPDTAQTVKYGGETTFTYKPNEGYHLASVTVDGSDVTAGNENNYTFTNVQADHKIMVVYRINKYTVTFKPGNHAAPGMGNEKFKNIPHGTSWADAGITVPAYTADGYYYQTGWKDESGNSATIPTGTTPITGDMTFIAVWKKMAVVTVTGQSMTVAYDGDEHGFDDAEGLAGILPITPPAGVSAATVSAWEDLFRATGLRTNFGSTPVVVTGPDVLDDGEVPYQVNKVNGTLTVNKAAVTITADNASKYVGETDPTPFTAKVTSGTIYKSNGTDYDFTYGVTRSNVGAEAAVTYTGVLKVVPDTADPEYKDYDVTLVPGDFTINKRPTETTVTATPASGIPGSALTISGSIADMSGAAAYSGGFTGSVTITFNSHTYTAPVAANGTFTLAAVTARPMHTGSFTVTVSYPGDAVFTASGDTTTVTVTAAPIGTATLTIRYLLQGAGTQLADPYTETFDIGDAYSVAALTDKLISGYTRVSVAGSTSGTITDDVTITVYYRAAATLAPTPTPAATPTPTPTPTGTPVEVINPAPPKAGPEHAWALVNLIMTVLTAVWSAYMLLRYFGRRRDEDVMAKSATEIKKHGLKRIISLVPAIGGIVAFLLTEDVRNPMVFTDRWTLLMVAIFLIQAGVAAVAARSHKEEPKEA